MSDLWLWTPRYSRSGSVNNLVQSVKFYVQTLQYIDDQGKTHIPIPNINLCVYKQNANRKNSRRVIKFIVGRLRISAGQSSVSISLLPEDSRGIVYEAQKVLYAEFSLRDTAIEKTYNTNVISYQNRSFFYSHGLQHSLDFYGRRSFASRSKFAVAYNSYLNWPVNYISLPMD